MRHLSYAPYLLANEEVGWEILPEVAQGYVDGFYITLPDGWRILRVWYLNDWSVGVCGEYRKKKKLLTKKLIGAENR